MKIKLAELISEDKPKSAYEVTIDYMIGDADGWNTSTKLFTDMEELKQFIIWCEVLALQYPDGRGGCDNYGDLPFFEEHFEDEWSCSNDGDEEDSFDGYAVKYYDQTGQAFSTSIVLDDEDKKEIASYGVLNY